MDPERRRPSLTLHVQYATERPAPSRDRVRRWVRAALTVLSDANAHYALTVRFVDEAEARALNRSYRAKDHATNVLTFTYPRLDGRVEGDVVVCMAVVEREAREQRKASMQHCAHLVVHGTLHAAGLDHETAEDADAMEALERAALARFRISDPYAPIS